MVPGMSEYSSLPRAPSPEKWQSFSVEKDSGVTNRVYTDLLVPRPFLLRTPPPLQSVGPGLKTASGPGTEQETVTLSWDDQPLPLAFFGPLLLRGSQAFGTILSAPCQSPLPVVTRNMVSWSLLVKSHPSPLLCQRSLTPMDGDEPGPGPPSFRHLPWPAEESNRRTSW